MRRHWAEHGSAPAEFVMVSALSVLLALGVVQLALALHVRNTLIDAAAEGARYGALADQRPSDGARRTAELIRAALGSDYADQIEASSTEAGATEQLVQVEVLARIPLLGFLGVERSLRVSGHAVRENVS